MRAEGLKGQFLCASLRWLINLSQQFIQDYRIAACQDQAAALTYMTLFALVPLMTVTYAVFSMVPEFIGVAARVQKFLFSHFVPESGAVIQAYFVSFSTQAQKLTWIGALFLAVTAFLMLGNIERTFNKIWGVSRGRNGINKLLVYWAVLSIGPLLIGSAVALSTYVVSLKYWSIGSTIIPPYIITLYPVFISAATFSLLFIAVPNCNVPIKFGLIGGALAACAFEILKILFALAVANTNFKFIYGAFAALPLFLLWLNLVWVIVLGGAVLVRILAQKRYLLGRDGHSDFSAALVCLAVLRQGQLEGKSLDEMSFILGGVNQHHWQLLRDKWCEAGWISQTTSGEFVLCRDLAASSLWELAELINLRLADVLAVVGRLPQFPALRDYINPTMGNYKDAWSVALLTLIATKSSSQDKPLDL